MPLLNFRAPKCIITKKDVSYTGKYKLYFGHHFVQGKTCFDVGTINQTNGEIVSRHYREDWNLDAKAEALRAYDTLVKGMKRAPKSEEDDDNNPFIADEYRRQLKRGLS